MNRRHFLHTAAGLAALSMQAVSANDKVTLGFIGVRGRGKSLAARFAALPDVDIAYMCDVDERVLPRAAAGVEKISGQKPKLVGDLRRLLDDKSVDAVVVATPDHWHAPATILACAAGKDVYVEKPCSHNVREGVLMVEAARRYKRVVQVGTQARSRPSTQEAIEYIHSGKIGKVLMAKAWNVQLRRDLGHKTDSSVPAGVDYDTWMGPTPELPFNENRFHDNWRWHWNYGTGDIGNDGIHQIDQACWALDVEYPDRASGFGRKLSFSDDQQTPDTMIITYEHKDKVLMFEMRIWNPYRMEAGDNCIAVYGTDGMVQIGRWRGEKTHWKVFDKDGNVVRQEPMGSDLHCRNFVDCVRSRQAPNAEIATGFRSTLYAHLGNIVARTGRTIKFDGKTNTIAGDAEANALLHRQYRKHWATPRG